MKNDKFNWETAAWQLFLVAVFVFWVYIWYEIFGYVIDALGR